MDEEIVSMVQNKFQVDSDPDEIDQFDSVRVSYSDVANALEIKIRYVKHSDETSTDISVIFCHPHLHDLVRHF